MIPPDLHPDEEKRMEAVMRLGLLDTAPEERFDRVTRMAVAKLHVPISTVTIIDKGREWYKSCVGLEEKDRDRTQSFCAHALLSDFIFIIEDTLKDPRFADNPMVVGKPHIRFYAGMALYDKKTNLPVGVFCVKDTRPRSMTTEEVEIFMELAREAEKEINHKIDK